MMSRHDLRKASVFVMHNITGSRGAMTIKCESESQTYSTVQPLRRQT